MELVPQGDPPKYILPSPKPRNPTEAEVKDRERRHDETCAPCLYETYPWLA